MSRQPKGHDLKLLKNEVLDADPRAMLESIKAVIKQSSTTEALQQGISR
jgi:hypothetical protein